MKNIFLLIIKFYQNFFSYILKSITGAGDCCRFTPTCSEYARISIKQKGVLKGLGLSMVRFLKCQPFYKTV